MQIVAAITEFFKLLNLILVPLLNLIKAHNDKIAAENKRLEDAQKAEEKARLDAIAMQAKRASANLAAAMLIYSEAWKDRYNQILDFITNDKYENVLVLCNKVIDPELESILYNPSLSAEAKALQMTEIMRKATV